MRVALSEAITTGVQDPELGFVTVTAVRTSSDLRHARVYVSVLGDEAARERSLQALDRARGFLQSRIATTVRLKHTPTLVFDYDESIDRGARIDRILKGNSDEHH